MAPVLAITIGVVTISADTLGFFEQKFTSLNFERKKWSRTIEGACYGYKATEDGATVEVVRFGTSNLVHLKASKGLVVTVCGSTAIFDENFEAGKPPELAGADHP